MEGMSFKQAPSVENLELLETQNEFILNCTNMILMLHAIFSGIIKLEESFLASWIVVLQTRLHVKNSKIDSN